MDRMFPIAIEKLLFPTAIAFGLFVLYVMGADFGPLLDIVKGLPGIDHWFAESNQDLANSGVDTHQMAGVAWDRLVQLNADAVEWNKSNVRALAENTQ